MNYAISNRYEVKCFFGKFFLNIKKMGRNGQNFVKKRERRAGKMRCGKAANSGNFLALISLPRGKPRVAWICDSKVVQWE